MNETKIAEELERISGEVQRLSEEHDARQEAVRLTEEVTELTGALEDARKENDRLAAKVDEMTGELQSVRWDLAHMDDPEPILDALEDHRRGLIDTDELYERTVGR